jgi:hypothetical protein
MSLEAEYQTITERELSSLTMNNNSTKAVQHNMKFNLDYEGMQDQNCSQSISTSMCDRTWETHANIQQEEFVLADKNDKNLTSYDLNMHNFINEQHLPDLRRPYYEKLKENLENMTKNHAIFLHNRQESLKQISNIIQQQLALSAEILESEPN